jgi:hypothetical protein
VDTTSREVEGRLRYCPQGGQGHIQHLNDISQRPVNGLAVDDKWRRETDHILVRLSAQQSAHGQLFAELSSAAPTCLSSTPINSPLTRISRARGLPCNNFLSRLS